jgi:hypothetical protein
MKKPDASLAVWRGSGSLGAYNGGMETPVLSAAKLDMGSERDKSGDGDIHITVPGDGERAIPPRCEARHRRAGPSVREVFRVPSSERRHSVIEKSPGQCRGSCWVK